MKKLFTLIAIIIFAAALIYPLFAQPGQGQQGPGQGQQGQQGPGQGQQGKYGSGQQQGQQQQSQYGPGQGQQTSDYSSQNHALLNSIENIKKLNLTDEQRKSINELAYQYDKERIKLEADYQLAELDLNQILNETTLDANKAEIKLREMQKHRTDLLVLKLKTYAKALGLLTKEQIEMLKKSITQKLR